MTRSSMQELRDLTRRARSDPRRRCWSSGKVRFADEGAALRALEVMRRLAEAGHDHRREARHYQCAACNGWHVTSRPR